MAWEKMEMEEGVPHRCAGTGQLSIKAAQGDIISLGIAS
jgi:hypothetical protein